MFAHLTQVRDFWSEHQYQFGKSWGESEAIECLFINGELHHYANERQQERAAWEYPDSLGRFEEYNGSEHPASVLLENFISLLFQTVVEDDDKGIRYMELERNKNAAKFQITILDGERNVILCSNSRMLLAFN